MNKRQAKKAFKKKYGVNPNQMGKALLDFDWYKFGQDLGKAVTTAVAIIAEKMANISKRLEAIDWQEVYKNEQINITERKALLDMWDDVQSTQTPCDTREKEQ